MYKGTTPTITFTFSDFDPSRAEKIIVTFKTGGTTTMEFENDDLTITESAISLYLTQEQTLNFRHGDMSVQINFKFADGSRCATQKKTISWEENLHNEVIA